VDSREAQCREHQRAADKRKGTRTARGYDNAWLGQSKRRRKAFPVCEWEGCLSASTTTDHIDGDNTNDAWDNLRALCWFHHNSRTGRDQPGGSVRG
jgi:5-methylcytosine-specific restriction protein A